MLTYKMYTYRRTDRHGRMQAYACNHIDIRRNANTQSPIHTCINVCMALYIRNYI